MNWQHVITDLIVHFGEQWIVENLELSKGEEERALSIHQKAIFINALDASVSFHETSYLLDKYILKLRKEGVTAINTSIETPSDDIRGVMKTIGEWYSVLERGSDEITLATAAEDIKKAKNDKKIAVIFGFQQAHVDLLENDLNLLLIYHRLGVRTIQLTYNERNSIGDGCYERTDCGLSNFGVQVIEQMNSLGILIDLSHVGCRSTMEAIDISRDPCCFTHANPRSLCDKPRNKADEQIKALAEKGGIIGITYFCNLLRNDRLPTFWGDYVDHIEYVVDLVGVDHVGIGLDISYGLKANHPQYAPMLKLYPELYAATYTPEERLEWYTNDEARWFDITRGLVARGYSDEEIEKILGLNFLNIFERVWGR